jgi:hypothetical protein
MPTQNYHVLSAATGGSFRLEKRGIAANVTTSQGGPKTSEKPVSSHIATLTMGNSRNLGQYVGL